MKILAFDTTFKFCSVALMKNNKVFSLVNKGVSFQHSETIIPLIEKIFEIFSGLVPSIPKAKNVSVGKAIGSLSNIDLVNNEIFFVNIAICNNYLIYSIISKC